MFWMSDLEMKGQTLASTYENKLEPRERNNI